MAVTPKGSRHWPVFPGYGQGWRFACGLEWKTGVISHMNIFGPSFGFGFSE
jgi:hypothetical protein